MAGAVSMYTVALRSWAMEESSGVVLEELKADGGAVLLAGWHSALEVTMREPAG